MLSLVFSIQIRILTDFQPERSPTSAQGWVTDAKRQGQLFSKGKKKRKENLLKYVNKDLVGTQDFYCAGFEREDLTETNFRAVKVFVFSPSSSPRKVNVNPCKV